MILSRTTEYAIRLIFHLSEKQPLAQYVRIKDVAKELNVSYNQLAKVANTLISNNILKSSTGPTGGIDLGDNISDLPMSKILEVFGQQNVFDECILGLHECSDQNPCPIHTVWGATRSELKAAFFNRTLGELQKEILLPIIKSPKQSDEL